MEFKLAGALFEESPPPPGPPPEEGLLLLLLLRLKKLLYVLNCLAIHTYHSSSL